MVCRHGYGITLGQGRLHPTPSRWVQPHRERIQTAEAVTLAMSDVRLSMLELETLAAFVIGAGLMALVPAVAAVAGKESKLTTAVSNTGRSITKQGLKVGLVVADKTSGVVKSVGRGLSEVGESFTDVLAEAKNDLAQTKPATDASKPSA